MMLSVIYFSSIQKGNMYIFFVPSGSAVGRGPAPANPGCRPQWCCHCKVVVLGNGVQKAIKDLPAQMKVPNKFG